MRRTFLPFVLSLLFVCAQQAGLVHAIGHGAHGVASSQNSAGAPEASPAAGALANGTDEGGSAGSEKGTYCDKCFQFAHVAGAAFSCVSCLLVVEAARDVVPRSTAVILAVDAPHFRSRGPPAVL